MLLLHTCVGYTSSNLIYTSTLDSGVLIRRSLGQPMSHSHLLSSYYLCLPVRYYCPNTHSWNTGKTVVITACKYTLTLTSSPVGKLLSLCSLQQHALPLGRGWVGGKNTHTHTTNTLGQQCNLSSVPGGVQFVS